MRFRLYVNPTRGCRMTLDEIKQKILSRCEWRDGPLETQCLVWTGPRIPKGYGYLRRNNERLVHRVMYSIEKGQIPKGFHICHRCDNPPCCNVDHLFIGTNADNLIDACRKGRHSAAKLTEADVSLIKYHLQNGWGGSEIARRYNVSPSTISRIKTEWTWRYVQPIEGQPLPSPLLRRPKPKIDLDAILANMPLELVPPTPKAKIDLDKILAEI
jgi:HNH endonuclease/Homeodomain-like domain